MSSNAPSFLMFWTFPVELAQGMSKIDVMKGKKNGKEKDDDHDQNSLKKPFQHPGVIVL